MSKYATFEELKENRKELVEVVRKNGMLEGLTRLLTELYPDEAHFIYELLQNAEDKEATEVKFVLYDNKLVFMHNGKKRDFILDDIDAITNIGQSTKIDDPTAIGKFGVGFKAVYAYTSTPEIHSGEYDFKIINMLIPENDGVAKKAKSGITQFVFPFDNPLKPQVKAVEEIKAGLLALDENSIIFLKNIKQIIFILPDGKTGGVRVKDKDNKINKVIMHVDALTGEKTKTYWTKFSKDCCFEFGGQEFSYPVSIAYRMKKIVEDDITNFVVDSELKGNVCIYFPAVKEHSNLHFHINAPFASTVARDSVRSCPENRLFIKEIAKLVVQSIYYFKNEKLLDLNFYAAMPTKRDFDFGNDSEYYFIYSKVMEAFKTQEFIVTESGEYKKISEVLQSNRDIVKLINTEDVYKLFKKYWVPAVNPQTRELYFLMELNIKQYDRRTVADALKINPKFFDGLFENKSAEWFRDWYALLDDVVGFASYVDSFARVSMIKCQDGTLHKATDEIYLYNSSYKPVNINNPIYVDFLETKTATSDKAKKFLQMLGIKIMSEEIDIMADISNKSVVDSDDVVLALMKIIEKFNAGEDISLFKDQPLFLARDYNSDNGFIVKAGDCCVSNEVAFFYKNSSTVKYILRLEDYSALNSFEEREGLIKVFKELGGKIKPEIYSATISWNHPQYKQLDTSNERYDTCLKQDYTLTGIEQISKIKLQGLFKESLLLWNVVLQDKNMYRHEAKYRANLKSKQKIIESTIAYYLRREEWIPNKEGVFCRPCDITKDDLYEGFVYSDNCVFLKNIGFGDKSKAPSNIAIAIKKAGFEISEIDEQWFQMLDEDKQAFIEFIEKRQAFKEQQRKSFSDALSAENKDQVDFEEEDHYGEDISIKKVAVRQERQRKEFEEGLEFTPKKHQVWRPVYQKSNGFEKEFVGEQYHGKCQICGRDAIRKANGKQYFEAINIINTSLLNDEYLNNLDTGWNTLCLCPNCAAEYKYCQKNLSDLQEQVEGIFIKERKNEYIELSIMLKNKKTKILFTPRHFLALQTAFQEFKKHESK